MTTTKLLNPFRVYKATDMHTDSGHQPGRWYYRPDYPEWSGNPFSVAFVEMADAQRAATEEREAATKPHHEKCRCEDCWDDLLAESCWSKIKTASWSSPAVTSVADRSPAQSVNHTPVRGGWSFPASQ